MIVNISPKPGDDPAFLTALSGCAARLVVDRQPHLVYLLRVTKWFDHKWLQYSGKGRVKLDGFAGFKPDHDPALATEV